AIIGLDKAKTLLAIEPLDSACRHFLLQSISRVTITRFHSTGRCLWEIARRRIQKGTAANRIGGVYSLRQGNTSAAARARARSALEMPETRAEVNKLTETLPTRYRHPRYFAALDLREHCRLQPRNAFLVALVERPLLDALGADEARARQYAHVLADRRLADAEFF